MAGAVLLAACGGSGGGGGATATNTKGGGAGGCAAGAAGSANAVTVAAEPDSGVATATGKCWASIKGTPITVVGTGSIPSGDATTFKVAWSAKALYVQAYSAEWPINAAGGANWWQSDATEYTVSGTDDHGGAFDSQTFQWGVISDGTLGAGTGASTAPAQPTPLVSKVANKGFYTQLTVPWSILGVTAPKKGQKYQFDLAQDYGDASGARVGQALWIGSGSNFYNSTTDWGDITLG